MSPSESGRTHPREKEVFLKALEIRDRVARDKFIASVSGNDEVLRKRVERLFEKGSEEDEFLSNPELRGMIGVIEPRFLDSEKPAFDATTMAAQAWEPNCVEPKKSWSIPPTSVGRYQIHKLIGEGSFGSVYKGFDPNLNR
ncbi:hypothetical protein OAK43_01435 [Verrucomicrobiales bacterium]|nr:hypothetical protein [Verrucomicrobiales bacterium]MDC0322521.1 hypothetical protein [Verrucomicrobiales bacterium]